MQHLLISVLTLFLTACTAVTGFDDLHYIEDADGDVETEDAETIEDAEYPDGDTEEDTFVYEELDEDWAVIPAGSFTMGSPESELGREPGELQHYVTITRALRVMRVEMSRELFSVAMGYDPTTDSCREAGPCPVGGVTWTEAARVANALSLAAEREPCYECNAEECWGHYVEPADCEGYRLPTEAEWEYSARGGTTAATYNGELVRLDCEGTGGGEANTVDEIAWYRCNADYSAHASAELRPNSRGLYDMLGNRAEPTSGWMGEYSAESVVDPTGPAEGETRVYRGSGYTWQARYLRAATRNHFPPEGNEHVALFGVRLVRTMHGGL